MRPITLEYMDSVLEEAYSKFKTLEEGENASYIPFLAEIPSSLFGITACLPDGSIISKGDTDYQFGIESVSKVPTAILALRQHGKQTLLEKIGADATGLPFNSIFALLLENEHPSTPLVNAGAITACSMVEPKGDKEAKWKAIVDNITQLCGSEPVLLEKLFESEMETNWNNQAITALLKAYDRIYDIPSLSLELYTKQCSLGITCQQLAIMGATIANGGINPVTKEKVFDEDLTPQIVSLIATVGFYEATGDWLYTSGIPAKTGVGGGIMGTLPGKFGIAAFSPKLDGAGNSVRAQEAIKFVMQRLDLHIFKPY